MQRNLLARASRLGSKQAVQLTAPVASFASSGSRDSGKATHFGFQSVDESEKAGMVGKVFHNVAQSYDVMNDLMSGGVHRLWKDEFVRQLGPIHDRGTNTVVLDVAGGTGDIAFRIARTMQESPLEPASAEIKICDINSSMLEVGRVRAREQGLDGGQPKLTWIEGDAEKLEGIEDNSIDAYTIAFGIRNVTHVDEALRQAYRVLKPGGRFMCLEFSKVENYPLSQLYETYSFNVIPAIGQLVANDRDSYQYLVESIRQFPDQETFADMIRDAGFQVVRYENLTGGICAIHSGFKL